MSVQKSWFITAGVSLNQSTVEISRLNRYPVTNQRRTYRNELAPRLAILKKLTSYLSLLASVSKGFSPPTTSEVLPSTGVISTELEAEQGWNYEVTARYGLFKNKLYLEATGFYFKLNDALVQRRDLSGADYFVNAGDVKQKGAEFHAQYIYSPLLGNFINYLMIRGDYTYNHFRYGSFLKGADDFSGKTVPSVPSNTISVLADLQLKNGAYVNVTYYDASKNLSE